MRTPYHQQLRRDALLVLGGRCARCGFEDARALQIDHIDGGGRQERRGTGGLLAVWRRISEDETCRTRYQLLCANCNWIKRAEKGEAGGRKATR